MSIPYTYEIINVNRQARVMEVVYSSPGRQTMHISARLPFAGESLEDVIQMFSPVAYWREQEAEVVVPELGSGEVIPPEPPPPPPVVIPQSVTMRQARLALLRAGLLDDVDAAIAAIPDPAQRKAAEIEWEYAQTVDRNSPFTQQMAAGLNLTAEQLDALFTQAAGL